MCLSTAKNYRSVCFEAFWTILKCVVFTCIVFLLQSAQWVCTGFLWRMRQTVMEHATVMDLSASTAMVPALMAVKTVGLGCHVIHKVGLCLGM